jgi:hypothetical protein
MIGDGHVPFRGSLGVKLPGATRLRLRPVGTLVETSLCVRGCDHRAFRGRLCAKNAEGGSGVEDGSFDAVLHR